MDHFIDQIDIRNFKSIREMTVSGFKRINLFIGRPNVGKSNILEALSLFSLPYVWEGSKKLIDLVRLVNPFELFFDGNYEQPCLVSIDFNSETQEPIVYEVSLGAGESLLKFKIYTNLRTEFTEGKPEFSQERPNQLKFHFDSELKISSPTADEYYEDTDHIIRYIFRTSNDLKISDKQSLYTFLIPPFGDNLLQVLRSNTVLREHFAQWFQQYGLRLVFDRASQSLKVMKDKGDTVFLLPYSSVADTLQRIIFYKTAVASNENSVLLFEEPEAHAYPPYISEFTREVVKSTTNQFFIVTHSPLIVEQFLTDAIDDLGIFMVDFKDGQTVVKGLTTDEIREVYRYGMDLFFNGDSYLV